jgi:hypothetical protein
MSKEARDLLWLVIAIGIVSLLCILYCLHFTAGTEQPDNPDYDTVIVPTQVEAVSLDAPVPAAAETVVQVDNVPEDTTYHAATFTDEVATYLNYTGASYDHLVDGGRRLDAIDRGIPAVFYPATDAYKEAAYIAYYALCWDTFIAFYAPGSPWVGRGIEVVAKCRAAGIDWAMAAATLYAESSFGCVTSGLVWGNASTLDGWIAWCLREMANPNDVDNFVNEFHMPANIEIYRRNFGAMVERGRAWRP